MNEQNQNVETQALTTVDVNALAAAELDPGFGFFGGPAALFTTLPQNTDEEKALVLKAATSAPDKRPADLFAEPFPMQHILAHQVTLHNEKTGELVNAVRCVMIAPNGTTAGFVSEGIQRNLSMVFQLYGKPPYTPALFVRVKQVDTRSGKRTYNLEVLGRQVAQTAGKK